MLSKPFLKTVQKLLRINPKQNKLQDEMHKTSVKDLHSVRVVTMLAQNMLHGSALFNNSLHFHVHVSLPQTRARFDYFSMETLF